MIMEDDRLQQFLDLSKNYSNYSGLLENITCNSSLGFALLPHCSRPQAPENQASENNLIGNPGLQALFYVIYTIIFTVGVFGNVLVCYVVIRNKTMQTVTNFFITNLALSDILLCILAVPFTPLYSFLNNWIFGRVLCHTVSYAQGVSVYISTLTLTSIAIDRFFVIIYPFKPRMKISVCLIIICSIWTFAMVATLPYGIFMELVEDDEKSYCDEGWPSEKSRQIFGGCTTVLQFVVPFIIITFCYIRVSLKLRDRARAKIGAKSSRKEEADRERKRRTNRMLIAMVAIFGCSWLPINLVNFVSDLWMMAQNWPYYYLCFFIAHAIAVSSTCYNPFLYAWLNENFRKEFKQVLPCFGTENANAVHQRCSVRASAYHNERTCNGNNETVDEIIPLSNSDQPDSHANKVLYFANKNQIHVSLPDKNFDSSQQKQQQQQQKTTVLQTSPTDKAPEQV